MEVLGAVSGVAGLASLTGQCITGLQALRKLYEDIAAASKTVEAFLRDIDSLLRSLHDVRALLDKINAQAAPVVDDVSTLSLKIQLEDCNADIGGWLETARSFRPSNGKGGRAWFRRFWLAVNKDCVGTVRTEMHQRRTEIALSLSTLGR